MEDLTRTLLDCRDSSEGDLAVEYPAVIEQGETSWGAYVPDLPGVIAVGESAEEVEGVIMAAIPDHIEVLRETGNPIPAPHHLSRTLTVPA